MILQGRKVVEVKDVDQKMQIFTQNGKFYRKKLKPFFVSVTEVIKLRKKFDLL